MLKSYVLGALAALVVAGVALPAQAQVLNAVYRGTLVCAELPFSGGRLRGAIEVTIADGAARYNHVVRLNRSVDRTIERGTGTLTARTIALQGEWQHGAHRYTSNYSGTFVRRSAKLKGTQTWIEGGKTFTRACSGVIKRPLKAFLPRKGAKQAGQ
jgi:hypothetical protein